MKKTIVLLDKFFSNRIISLFYLIFSFGILDVWLRVNTRWINAYSIYELIPNAFTLIWAVLLTLLVTLVPSRISAQIVYSVLYFFGLLFSVVQYGAYLALGKFLYISDFMYANEGTDYLNWVLEYITPLLILQIVILIGIGVLGVVLSPHAAVSKFRKIIIVLALIVVCLLVIILLPKFYNGDAESSNEWNAFQNPAYEYEHFANPNFDMQLMGMYQYINRNVQVLIKRSFATNTEDIPVVQAFFSKQSHHIENNMTGIFENKNLIVVMMESMDDWLITPEHTPTLFEMKQHGIDFTNFYTPQYSNGYTFNTEFAFNTSLYPYSNGNAAYSLANNLFSCSLASIMTNNGYVCNSFHQGQSTFYNRSQMHQTWGYIRYNSYYDYPVVDVPRTDDRFLYMNDELYADLTSENRFYSFVITMSPHLPYNDDDELSKYALTSYPEYDVQTEREVNILRAKARLTDDMFGGLLNRLEGNGILDDTIIVCFSDHYSYGMTDAQLLQHYSEEAGSSILERTPAFIYSSELDESIVIDKVMQTTDLAPTILNLLGIDVPNEILGHDIFDEQYSGYAIFPNNTWITSEAYMKNGQLIWNNGMSEEEIIAMNAYVSEVNRMNDAILDTDYYRNRQ